jgi:hypothetical protein
VRRGVVCGGWQLSEDKVSVLFIDTPHTAPVDEKPRIFNVKISGGQRAGAARLPRACSSLPGVSRSWGRCGWELQVLLAARLRGILNGMS